MKKNILILRHSFRMAKRKFFFKQINESILDRYDRRTVRYRKESVSDFLKNCSNQ